MSIKNLLILVLGTVVFMLTATPVAAIDAMQREQVRQDKMELKKDAQTIKNTIKAKLGGKPTHITDATVTAINGSALTITKDNKSITVTTDGSTQFRRHFWGKSTFSEISVNNKVNVWGNWTDDTQTTILAKLIRNTSIMKKHGVFFGEITAKTDTSITIQSKERGTQTVNVSNTTKYINKAGSTIAMTDVSVSDKIRVRGLWDKTNNKITNVTEIKDFSK
jgi:hypothetical protein